MVRTRRLRLALPVLVALALSACSRPPPPDGPPDVTPSGPLPADPVPRLEPRSRYGNPPSYVVFGRRYHVMNSATGFTERGVASWYGSKFHGRRTSSGETYDMHLMTAAHKSLPLPTYVEVTNLENGRQIVVRVNDRGPFHDNRIIDLSFAAATKIGIVARGTGLVEIRAIDAGTTVPAATRVAAGSGAAAALPRAASASPPVRAPRIFLQAGAFVQRENARRLQNRLDSMLDVQVTVQPSGDPALPMHRVRVGPLPDVEAADRLTRRMVDAGLTMPQIVIE